MRGKISGRERHRKYFVHAVCNIAEYKINLSYFYKCAKIEPPHIRQDKLVTCRQKRLFDGVMRIEAISVMES